MGKKIPKGIEKSSSWKTKCGLIFIGFIMGLSVFPLFNPTIEKLEPYTHKFYNVCLESASDLLKQSTSALSKAQKAIKAKLKKNPDSKSFLMAPFS